MTDRKSVALLGVTGMLSGAIYLVATLRLPYLRYGREPVAWSQLLAGQPHGFAVCLAAASVLLGLYLAGWCVIRQDRRKSELRWIVWGGALAFAGTLVWLMPVTSDLFTYVTRAHLFTDLGTNPLLVAPVDLAADPLLEAYASAYSSYPAAYGPAWILLSAPGTAGAQDALVGVVYLKGLATLSFLACAYLVERLLRSHRKLAALEGLYLFSWNPLVLWMTAGDGHNDVAMMAAVLLALFCLSRGRWAVAAGALAISVWIKYVSLVFVPIVLVYGLGLGYVSRRSRDAGDSGAGKQGHDAATMPAAAATLGGLAASAVVLAPFWPLDWVPTAIRRLATPANWYGDPALLPTLVLGFGLLAYGLAYIPLLRGMAKDHGSQAALLDRVFIASLLIFLLGAARSQPWHLLWPASLAGLSQRKWAWPTLAALSVAMLLGQVWLAWGAPGLHIPA